MDATRFFGDATRDGDAAAYDRDVDGFDMAVGMAMRSHDYSLAEDAAQEAFLRLPRSVKASRA